MFLETTLFKSVEERIIMAPAGEEKNNPQDRSLSTLAMFLVFKREGGEYCLNPSGVVVTHNGYEAGWPNR
ncbi:MAG: hypothetical protein HA496_03475 [Thaumarchaeota archaeon]|jgi:hypothetical protein|nr:hypothetical protein [Nitrososphaerota archaeon]